MSATRIKSAWPADAPARERLNQAKMAALGRQDAWTDVEMLELPREQWFARRRQVLSTRLLSYGTLSVWLTCQGELWWSYNAGNFSTNKTNTQVLERLPADADASRVEQITKRLVEVAFAA